MQFDFEGIRAVLPHRDHYMLNRSKANRRTGLSQMQLQKCLEQYLTIPILHEKIAKSVVVQHEIGAP